MSAELGYRAPTEHVDLPLHVYEGGRIDSCSDCLPWHVEVFTTDDAEIVVREVHAAACPTLATLRGGDESSGGR